MKSFFGNNDPNASLVTILDDGTDIAVGELRGDMWLTFVQMVPHQMMNIDEEDTMLIAYLHKNVENSQFRTVNSEHEQLLGQLVELRDEVTSEFRTFGIIYVRLEY